MRGLGREVKSIPGSGSEAAWIKCEEGGERELFFKTFSCEHTLSSVNIHCFSIPSFDQVRSGERAQYRETLLHRITYYTV